VAGGAVHQVHTQVKLGLLAAAQKKCAEEGFAARIPSLGSTPKPISRKRCILCNTSFTFEKAQAQLRLGTDAPGFGR